MDDTKSLSHSKWRCKYHIVFAAKYRRQEVYGQIKTDIGQILRKLCEQKDLATLNTLRNNLRHVQKGYDSDATESADEDENVPTPKVFEDIAINEEYIIPSSYLNVSPRHDRERWEPEILKNSELLVPRDVYLGNSPIDSR